MARTLGFCGFVARLEVPGAGRSCGGWVWALGWRQEPGPARSWWRWADLAHPPLPGTLRRAPLQRRPPRIQRRRISGKLSSFASDPSSGRQAELVATIPFPTVGSSWLHQLLRTPDACWTLQPLGSPVLPAWEFGICKPSPGAWDGATPEQHLLLRWLRVFGPDGCDGCFGRGRSWVDANKISRPVTFGIAAITHRCLGVGKKNEVVLGGWVERSWWPLGKG